MLNNAAYRSSTSPHVCMYTTLPCKVMTVKILIKIVQFHVIVSKKVEDYGKNNFLSAISTLLV